ncbi:MAG: DEAD/DEAH box helicase, partial [Eubacteriales bacterium]|nr:DEAD/DEAH box helicase [Eubacteriales bacterium]
MELTALKGIGEKTAGAFNRLGIFSCEDLVRYYPRDYETFDKPSKLYELEPGKTYTVEGVLTKDASLNRFNGLTIVNAYLSDMTGRLQLSWYNAPFIKNSLKEGSHLVFRGRVYEKNGRLVMSQPKIYKPEVYEEKYRGRMMPIYPLTKGLSNNTIMKAAAEALTKSNHAEEYLPDHILEKAGLKSLEVTSIRMHFPRNEEELKEARRRAAFDEFFVSILAGRRLSDNAKNLKSTHRCKPDLRLLKFIAELPFELTAAQLKTHKEISADLSSGRVMNRLVEGDVGSGKTIVAMLAMLNAALNGYQAAIMAPTAVLAQQHFDTFNRLLEKNDGFDGKISLVLLTGSMTAAEKKEAYRRIKEHEADIIIGTHTLFQEKIVYADLGLIVTDE